MNFFSSTRGIAPSWSEATTSASTLGGCIHPHYLTDLWMQKSNDSVRITIRTRDIEDILSKFQTCKFAMEVFIFKSNSTSPARVAIMVQWRRIDDMFDTYSLHRQWAPVTMHLCQRYFYILVDFLTHFSGSSYIDPKKKTQKRCTRTSGGRACCGDKIAHRVPFSELFLSPTLLVS